jgi:hypothetical protein
LFHFGGSEAYIKDTTEHPIKKSLEIGNMGIPVAVLNEQEHGDDDSSDAGKLATNHGRADETVLDEEDAPESALSVTESA